NGEDTHAFRLVLSRTRLRPLQSVDELLDRPANKILIVLGRTDVIDKSKLDLRRFVADGGAVLIATDRSTDRQAWATDIGVNISGARVTAYLAQAAYRATMGDCPLVKECRRPLC